MSTRGARITKALAARGRRKQHALARALNVHESAITRWKKDGNISLDHAIGLCRELDVSADWLLLGIGHMDQHKSFAKPVAAKYIQAPDAYSELRSILTQRSTSLLVSFVKSISE
jgi:plasmid maintenance system antidote protein VapI